MDLNSNVVPQIVLDEAIVTPGKLAKIMVDGGAIVVDQSRNIKGIVLPNNAASVRQIFSQWVERV